MAILWTARKKERCKTVTDTREWEQGRVLDRFRVNQEEAIQAIVKGLKAVGYSVDLSPGLTMDILGKSVPFGAIITIYRKER